MARQAKSLVKEHGILSTPNHLSGHPLPRESVDCVTQFYEDDQFSRIMPGKKDFISVREPQGRAHIQKRLILCNLKELYQ